MNELNYAVHAGHDNKKSRKIALQIEERALIKTYIMNLRDETWSLVRPLKPQNINKAQQEALEAEILYREKIDRDRTLSIKQHYQKRPAQRIHNITETEESFAEPEYPPGNHEEKFTKSLTYQDDCN